LEIFSGTFLNDLSHYKKKIENCILLNNYVLSRKLAQAIDFY